MPPAHGLGRVVGPSSTGIVQQSIPSSPKVFCLKCCASKVKCIPCFNDDTAGSTCARCSRLQKDCVYVKHKRGRKPEPIRFGELEKKLESILQELRAEKEGRRWSEDDVQDDAEPEAKSVRAETTEILTNWSSAVNSDRSSINPSSSSSVDSLQR